MGARLISPWADLKRWQSALFAIRLRQQTARFLWYQNGKKHIFIALNRRKNNTGAKSNLKPQKCCRIAFGSDSPSRWMRMSAVQSQKAVTAHFRSKQLLPFSFARQIHIHHQRALCTENRELWTRITHDYPRAAPDVYVCQQPSQ